MPNEQLEEAAKFYQSIVSTFPDEVFPRMARYFKKHFQVTDPAVVRQGIKQIREYLGLLNPWEREVARLEEVIFRKCQEHSDIPVCVCTEEWTENLISGDVRQYFEEEYKVRFEIGAKVRRIPLINEIPNSGMMRYGIVLANETAYIVNRDPFEEQGMHDYKQHKPRQEDFESSEAYAAALREYNEKEITRQARILALAEMLFISWCDRDGKQIAKGWARPDQLQEYEENANATVTT